MSSNQFVEIGTIQRTHGVNGEFQVTWNNDFYLEEQNLESVFIEIEGIPIPFFISSIRSKGEDKALIKLDDVDDVNVANEFVGMKLLLPSDQIQTNDDELLMSDLVGFTIISNHSQVVGKIIDYQEYQSNSVFTVIHQSGSELMIPAADDLIVEIDVEGKSVVMEIPDGLIDLYLE
jgi:16S rRNA processing protein RimM